VGGARLNESGLTVDLVVIAPCNACELTAIIIADGGGRDRFKHFVAGRVAHT